MIQLEFEFMKDVKQEKQLHPCTNLAKFLRAEMKVIGRHLDEHKWFQHIQDKDDAIIDFNNRYGFVMREMFCQYGCDKRDGCAYYERLRDDSKDVTK